MLQGGANFSRFNIDQWVTISEQVDEVEIVIDPKDIELSTARSGGAGGKYITLGNRFRFWCKWNNSQVMQTT
jgi:hypothetical protein